MNLFEARTQFGLSQVDASKIVNIPLRTYIRYESDDSYGDSLKRQAIIDKLISACEITETKGLLTIEKIKTKITEIFDNEYKGEIDFCYLFGSYAKGYASEKSDIDLCVSTSLTGFRFAGLSEKIRSTLHKKIDLVRLDNLKDNVELINEIMKGGLKIYG